MHLSPVCSSDLRSLETIASNIYISGLSIFSVYLAPEEPTVGRKVYSILLSSIGAPHFPDAKPLYFMIKYYLTSKFNLWSKYYFSSLRYLLLSPHIVNLNWLFVPTSIARLRNAYLKIRSSSPHLTAHMRASLCFCDQHRSLVRTG